MAYGDGFPLALSRRGPGEGNHSHLRWPVPLTLTLSRRGEGTVCAAPSIGIGRNLFDSTRRPLPENFAGFARYIIHSSNSSSSSGSKSSSLVPLRTVVRSVGRDSSYAAHRYSRNAMQFMNQINQAFRVFSNQLFSTLLRTSGRKSSNICSISRVNRFFLLPGVVPVASRGSHSVHHNFVDFGRHDARGNTAASL